jgi:predicted ester cyclase
MTNKEIAKAWFADIDSNNFDGVKTLMDSRHAFHNPMTLEPAGKDQHIGMMQMMTTSFKGQHHVELLISEGEYVTVKGKWSGTHAGEFNGVPATNKHVEFSFIDIFRIINGKVTDEYFEMNPMSIMMQIGPVSHNA